MPRGIIAKDARGGFTVNGHGYIMPVKEGRTDDHGK